MIDSPTQMEPIFPTSRAERLTDLAVELLRQSAALGSQLRRPAREAMIALLRQMNSHYSNLTEGHNTHRLTLSEP